MGRGKGFQVCGTWHHRPSGWSIRTAARGQELLDGRSSNNSRQGSRRNSSRKRVSARAFMCANVAAAAARSQHQSNSRSSMAPSFYCLAGARAIILLFLMLVVLTG